MKMEIPTEGLDITKGIAIDPETGEFNPDLIPEDIRSQVEEMARYMSQDALAKAEEERRAKNRAKNKRKPKPRVKQPKTFGKNKKK